MAMTLISSLKGVQSNTYGSGSKGAQIIWAHLDCVECLSRIQRSDVIWMWHSSPPVNSHFEISSGRTPVVNNLILLQVA